MAAKVNPHDPGPEVAGKRAKDVLDAAVEPIELKGGGTVRVGTASWTDPTMTAGTVFYPQGRRLGRGEAAVLRVSQFPLVEIDATYYACPARAHGRAVARAHAARLHVRRQGARADDRPTNGDKATAEVDPRGAARRARGKGADLRARPARRSCARGVSRCSWKGSSHCARRVSSARSCCSTPSGSFPSARVATQILEAREMLGPHRRHRGPQRVVVQREEPRSDDALPDRQQAALRDGRRAAGLQEQRARRSWRSHHPISP